MKIPKQAQAAAIAGAIAKEINAFIQNTENLLKNGIKSPKPEESIPGDMIKKAIGPENVKKIEAALKALK